MRRGNWVFMLIKCTVYLWIPHMLKLAQDASMRWWIGFNWWFMELNNIEFIELQVSGWFVFLKADDLSFVILARVAPANCDWHKTFFCKIWLCTLFNDLIINSSYPLIALYTDLGWSILYFIPSNFPQSSLSSHKSQSNIRTEADGSIILLIHFPHAAEPLPSFKAGQGFLSLQYTYTSRLLWFSEF